MRRNELYKQQCLLVHAQGLNKNNELQSPARFYVTVVFRCA